MTATINQAIAEANRNSRALNMKAEGYYLANRELEHSGNLQAGKHRT